MKKTKILRHSAIEQLPRSETSFFLPNFSVFHSDTILNDSNQSLIFEEGQRSDFFSIVMVTKGSMTIKINHEEAVVAVNTLLIASPHHIKQVIKADKNAVMEGVSFTSDFFREISLQKNLLDAMEFFLSKQVMLWQLTQPEADLFHQQIIQLSYRTAQLKKQVFGRELLASSFTTFLLELAEIANRHSPTETGFFGRKEELVFQFTQLAMKHHLTERQLGFYSNKLFVTTKHLSEMTKQATGKTAGEILDELNLLEAKRLLEKPNLSIAEITFELRFSSPAFFSKFFKRLTGQSPKDFRKQLFR